MKLTAILAVFAITIQNATAFTVVQFTSPNIRSSNLQMKSSEFNEPFNQLKKVATVASLLVGTMMTAPIPPVDAMSTGGTSFTENTSIVISARSGGRMGGRVSAPRSMPRGPPPSAARRYGTTVRSSTTYIAPPPVVIGSPFGISPFGYNPLGGFGLGYGMGAMDNVGNTIRDYRQEGEIQQEKVELEAAKARAAQLEERIKALEEAQK